MRVIDLQSPRTLKQLVAAVENNTESTAPVADAQMMVPPPPSRAALAFASRPDEPEPWFVQYADPISFVISAAKLAAAGSPKITMAIGAIDTTVKVARAKHELTRKTVNVTAATLSVADVFVSALPFAQGVPMLHVTPGLVSGSRDLLAASKALSKGDAFPHLAIAASHDAAGGVLVKGLKVFGVSVDPTGASTSASVVQSLMQPTLTRFPGNALVGEKQKR